MTDDLGSGPLLDEHFDFSVGETGDLLNTTGVGELQKDLAIRMVLGLSQYLGSAPSNNIGAKVGATATKIAVSDSRVDSVDKDSIQTSFNSDRDELRLQMTVFTSDGEQELVFNV